jgi:hypothetical protein
MFPNVHRHLLTSDEQLRISACNDLLRRSHRNPGDPSGPPSALAIPLPAPPTDGKGAPDHNRDALTAYVASYELVAAQNAQVDAAQTKIDDLRGLVRRATAADGAGAGQRLPGELTAGIGALPRQDDPKYATPTAWLADYVPAVDAMVASLTALVRQGFRSP